MTFSLSYVFYQLNLLHNLCHRLALLLCMRAVGSHMTDGDDCHSLEIVRREQLAHDAGVVIAHPASAQTTLRSGKAEVLGGDGYIHVAVLLVIVSRVQQALLFFIQTM